MTISDTHVSRTAWPTDRGERRAFALAAVAAIADELQSSAQESEALNRMSDRSIEALRTSGVLGIMTPDDLGGNVVDPVTAFEIVERIGYIDPATAWTTTILLEGAGELATVLAPHVATDVFEDGVALKAASLKPGNARQVEGGYFVSGTWDFVSGLHHADYVSATFLDAGPNGEQIRRAAVLSRDAITLCDDWRVLGMRGTGSSSFQAKDVYVADEYVYEPLGAPMRGDTPLALMGMVPYVLQMHPGMVLGAARRALDEVISAAPRMRRGSRINLTQPPSLSEQTWFQRELGELDARVLAARALSLSTNSRVRDVLDAGQRVDLELLDAMQTAATFAAKTAVEVVTRIFRHVGAAAIVEGSLYARLLRDLNTISAHGVLSEAGFETHAEFILGLQDETNRRMV